MAANEIADPDSPERSSGGLGDSAETAAETRIRTHSGFGIDLNPFIRQFDLIPLGALLALLHSSKITREKGPNERHLVVIADTPQEGVNYPVLLSREIRDLIFRIRRRVRKLGHKSFDFSERPSFDDWLTALDPEDPRASERPVDADAASFAAGKLLPVGAWAADWTWDHALDLVRDDQSSSDEESASQSPYGAKNISAWCSRMARYRGQNKKAVYEAICGALKLDNIVVTTFSEFLEKDSSQRDEFYRIFNFLKRFFTANKQFRSKLLKFVPKRIIGRVKEMRGSSADVADYNIYMFALWLFQANKDVTLITHGEDKEFQDFLSDILCSNDFNLFLERENEFLRHRAKARIFVDTIRDGLLSPPEGMTLVMVERLGRLADALDRAIKSDDFAIHAIMSAEKQIFEYCHLLVKKGGLTVLQPALRRSGSSEIGDSEILKFSPPKVIAPYPGDRKLTREALRVPYNVRGVKDTVIVTDGMAVVKAKVLEALAPGSPDSLKPHVRRYIQEIMIPILKIHDERRASTGDSAGERKSYSLDDPAAVVQDLWDKILLPIQERLRESGYRDIIGYGNGYAQKP